MEEENADVQNIDLQPLNVSPESSSLLYFDLETTGLRKSFITGLNINLIVWIYKTNMSNLPLLGLFLLLLIFFNEC